MDTEIKNNNSIDIKKQIQNLSEVDSDWVLYLLNFLYENEITDFDIFFESIFKKRNDTLLEKNECNEYTHPVIKTMYDLLKGFNDDKNNIQKSIADFENNMLKKIKEENG